MLEQSCRDGTYAKLRQMISNISTNDDHSTASDAATNDHSDNSNGPETKRVKKSHMVTFNEYMDDSNDADKDELDRYLDADVGQAADLEPSEFWTGEAAQKFPRLAVIAKQLIMRTPTVTRSCQLHPMGRLLSARRNLLAGQPHMDEILLLHSLFTT